MIYLMHRGFRTVKDGDTLKSLWRKMTMSRKENNLKRELEALKEQQTREITMQVTIAWMTDVAIIAAHNCWGIGKGRMGAFIDEMQNVLNDMCAKADVDTRSNNDKHFLYTKAKVDEVIKSIVPDDYFVPWEQRYHAKTFYPGDD